MNEFRPMGKIPRLSREIVITEKIDGTNASVWIAEDMCEIRAGSRTRWITAEDDNHGFAKWVWEHHAELLTLGPGHHFGEWWGGNIQRGYSLQEKRFSLFNVGRWTDPKGAFVPCSAYPIVNNTQWAPACCHVVPILYRGLFEQDAVDRVLRELQSRGSRAAPGFMDPEGIVVYHTAANICFKKTIKGDEEGKHAEAYPPKLKAPRQPKEPSIMWTGGRRKSGAPYPEHAERRKLK